MFTLPHTPIKLGGLFSNAWRLYKSTFLKTWKWSGLMGALIVIVSVVANSFNTNMQSHNGLFTSIGLLGYLILVLISMFCQNAILSYLADKTGLRANSNESYIKNALKRLPKTFGASLVLLVVFVAAGAIIALPLLLIKWAGIGLMISVLLAIIGVLLFVFYVYCVPLVVAYIVIDNRGIFWSLIHSVTLVWKHWWQTFFLFFLPIPILTMIGISLGMIIGFSAALISLLTSHGQSTELVITSLVIILQFALNLFYIPYFISQSIVQFNNLKNHQIH